MSYPLYLKTNMESQGSRNVTGLKLNIILVLNLVLVVLVQSRDPYYHTQNNIAVKHDQFQQSAKAIF